MRVYYDSIWETLPQPAPHTQAGQSFWCKEPPILGANGKVNKGGMFPHQRDCWDLQTFIIALIGGYGSGKTLWLSKRAIAAGLHNAPVPAVIVSPTYPMAKLTTIPTIKALLQGKRTLLGKDFRWRFVGSPPPYFEIAYRGRQATIFILSGEHPTRLKGGNIGWAGIDEPFIQDQEVFEQIVARVRHPQARFTEICLTGCVDPETLVLSDTGIREIQDFDPGCAPKQYHALDQQIYGIGGFHKATKFYNNGIDDTLRLTLAKGFELVCTPDHPVMVMGPDLEPVFKRVGHRKGKYGHLAQLDLTADCVAVARGMNVWGDSIGLSPDAAYGLGAWIAEGSFDHGVGAHRFSVTCGDQELLTHFCEIGLFGVQFQQNRKDQVRKGSAALEACFRSLGMPLVKSPKRRLPSFAMGGADKETTLHFLAGLYDGDGHVALDGSGIGYTTSSRKLARQLQVLLTNLGVCADFIETDIPPTACVHVASRRHQVVATGKNAAILAALLPLRVPRKRDALAIYRRDYRCSDVIPKVGAAILHLWNLRRSQRWRCGTGTTGYRICESIRQRPTDGVSYAYVKRFCELWRTHEDTVPDEIRKLEKLVHMNYFWAPVRSLVDAGRRPTVDFVIPDTHSFTPNGVVSLQTPESLNWGYDLCEGELGDSYDVGVVHASTYQNLALPSGYAERMESGFTEHATKAFVHGLFINMVQGRVYYTFDKLNNVVTMNKPDNAEVCVGMDFNVDPMAFILFWRVGDRMHIFQEFELPNSDTEYACHVLREHQWVADRQNVLVFPDPSGKARQTNAPAGQSDFTILQRNGFQIMARNRAPAIRDRENAVNAKLRPARGEISLTIDPSCKKLMKYLNQYTHQEKQKQKHMSHLLDAMGYAIDYLWPVARRSATAVRY